MKNFPTNLLTHGTAEPAPEQIPLRAGPLTMIYENGDLRYIKLGEREIVRRLYVAIRDRNWNTAANQLSDVQMEIGTDSFTITYSCTNRLADVDFVWQGTLHGSATGAITSQMAGQAQSSFQRNRIGFCLLHPSAIAGAPARITHVDGQVESAIFPIHIAPQLVVDGQIKPVAPFQEMKALAHEIEPGRWCKITFAGDIFELEDQRNWTDASYKTYSTPLRLPFPVMVTAGTAITQEIAIAIDDEQATVAMARQPAEKKNEITFNVGSASTPLPRLGLGLASHGQPLQATEIAALRALQLAHLRVDLSLTGDQWQATVERAAAEVAALDVKLEVALHLSADAVAELRAFVAAAAPIAPSVVRWLIFHSDEKTTTAQWVDLARQQLAPLTPDVPIGAGTNLYFTELNSRRPPVDALDCVAYSINPQVHAFDNSSLVETLAAQATTATSARQLIGDLPLVVSPITLQPRFNPNATGPEPEPAPGELPPQVDPRQLSLLGAGWTLGSIKYLAETGTVTSITYYETTGWRGVMERTTGSPLPAKFPSLPGAVFPLYHLLADVGDFAGGAVVASHSSRPLAVDGLVLRAGEKTRLLLANMTAAAQTVKIQGLSNLRVVRQLDAETVLQAMQAPEQFRAGSGAERPLGEAILQLPPHAVLVCDE